MLCGLIRLYRRYAAVIWCDVTSCFGARGFAMYSVNALSVKCALFEGKYLPFAQVF